MREAGKQRVPSESTAESLIRVWRAEGLKLNPPAGRAAIEKLESVLGIVEAKHVKFFGAPRSLLDQVAVLDGHADLMPQR